MTEQEMRDQAGIAAVQAWRRSVVRLWIVTMIAALAFWALLSALPVPPIAEMASTAVLLLLVGFSIWNVRRGKCPRCKARIRFRPRIELPRACPNCDAPFVAARDDVP